MAEFQFDASGVVTIMSRPRPTLPGSGPSPVAAPIGYTWAHLSPFAQGYVEALFADFAREGWAALQVAIGRPFGFSDLSPEAFAMILGDCERHLDNNPTRRLYATDLQGAYFWENRQAGLEHPDFPPLTVSLNDEGKVCLRERDQ